MDNVLAFEENFLWMTLQKAAENDRYKIDVFLVIGKIKERSLQKVIVKPISLFTLCFHSLSDFEKR